MQAANNRKRQPEIFSLFFFFSLFSFSPFFLVLFLFFSFFLSFLLSFFLSFLLSFFLVGLHRLGHRSHRRAQLRHACIRSLLRNFEASLLGERLHCLDTILLNLRRGHLSRFGAQKHIDTTRSVASPWPRLRPPTLPLWSSCILHPKLANFDERGQQEVIFGLTAHGEQLNLVAVGLAAQQLVIKLVHDRHLYSMRDGAEGLPCTSCRPKRFLIDGFGTTHTHRCCRVRVHPKPVELWDIECEERRKGYNWQCEVTSVDVVMVAIGLP